MKPTKKTLLYTAYIISITFFFLYYLFPSEAVKEYVAYKVSRANPGISLLVPTKGFEGYVRNRGLSVSIVPSVASFR